MDTLDEVVEYINKLPQGFFGQIIIKIHRGEIVLWEAHRTFKPNGERESQVRARE